jgi:5-methylcytosine-specific restriction endonuclease McrA
MNRLLISTAATDRTFSRSRTRWFGKCLICNGNLSFDERTGVGANLEHIVPRSRGGTNDLANLGVTHPACNAEKGRNWDSRKALRRHTPEEYQALLDRLLQRRRERWLDAETGPPELTE